MTSRIIAAALLAAAVLASNAGIAQTPDPHGFDRLHRLDQPIPYLRDVPTREPLRRPDTHSPGSTIPPRSPDLGRPYFPLTPSIGPGSGLLGPEAGRTPERLRSGDDPYRR